MRALPEHPFQVAKIAAFDQRQLELQQRVLAGIDVHCVNFRRRVQQIIQGIAAGAGQHHHPAVPVQTQQLPVNARVFPAHVVDQITLVNRLEQQIVGVIAQSGAELLDHATLPQG
jgi:hypothetical protein